MAGPCALESERGVSGGRSSGRQTPCRTHLRGPMFQVGGNLGRRLGRLVWLLVVAEAAVAELRALTFPFGFGSLPVVANHRVGRSGAFLIAKLPAGSRIEPG